MAGQNSGTLNGALVDHYLNVDGYRAEFRGGKAVVTELLFTDNAAGAGASASQYRGSFHVNPGGSIVKNAAPGANPGEGHDDIELEYQLAVVKVFQRDVTTGKGGTSSAFGVALEKWESGQKILYRRPSNVSREASVKP